MNLYFNNFYKWIVILILVGSPKTDLMSQAKKTDDSTPSVLLRLKQDFHNSIENSLSSLDPIQRLSIIRVYEQELDKAREKMDRSEYLEEKLDIAWRYMDYRDFDGAVAAYEKIAAMDPDSRFAAKAFMMKGWIQAYGDPGKPGLAVSALEKSIEILENLRKVPVTGQTNQPTVATQVSEDEAAFAIDRHEYQVNEMAGRALATLANVHFVNGSKEESIKVYEYLLSQKDILLVSEESVSVNALSTLARLLLEKGDVPGALERYEALDKLVKNSTGIPAWMKIGFAIERMSAMGRTVSEKELVEFLEEIWIGYKKDVGIETMRVGNSLVLAYYFSKDEEIKKKFASFCTEFHEFLEDLRKVEGLRPDDSYLMYRVSQQVLLLRAANADNRGEKKEVEESKEELKRVWDEKEEREIDGDFKTYVPSTFPMDVATEILKLRTRYWPEAKDQKKDSVEK